ncbi:unnamed protein product [Chrysodeixis includens]|uniref:Uncharacterized protein n=1 Tax=Chrysodeixis includens TaxID=689277 RepID=A0A9N8KWV4_CHRIL|nr:unnamed protein product [Chrysodeixis includens]
MDRFQLSEQHGAVAGPLLAAGVGVVAAGRGRWTYPSTTHYTHRYRNSTGRSLARSSPLEWEWSRRGAGGGRTPVQHTTLTVIGTARGGRWPAPRRWSGSGRGGARAVDEQHGAVAGPLLAAGVGVVAAGRGRWTYPSTTHYTHRYRNSTGRSLARSSPLEWEWSRRGAGGGLTPVQHTTLTVIGTARAVAARSSPLETARAVAGPLSPLEWEWSRRGAGGGLTPVQHTTLTVIGTARGRWPALAAGVGVVAAGAGSDHLYNTLHSPNSTGRSLARSSPLEWEWSRRGAGGGRTPVQHTTLTEQHGAVAGPLLAAGVGVVAAGRGRWTYPSTTHYTHRYRNSTGRSLARSSPLEWEWSRRGAGGGRTPVQHTTLTVIGTARGGRWPAPRRWSGSGRGGARAVDLPQYNTLHSPL